MFGFFMKGEHKLAAFIIAILLAIAGIVYGFTSGVFQENNRDALRAEREAAAITTH